MCYQKYNSVSATQILSDIFTININILLAYRILVGKPEGKRPLGRPRRRWVDNIKMNFRETGWDGMD
jgi:hypothetical protein